MKKKSRHYQIKEKLKEFVTIRIARGSCMSKEEMIKEKLLEHQERMKVNKNMSQYNGLSISS